MGRNAMEAAVGIALPPASRWGCIWPLGRCGCEDSGEHLTSHLGCNYNHEGDSMVGTAQPSWVHSKA